MYTTQQIADQLKITTGRVRQKAIALASKGLITPRIGRDWLFTSQEIELIQQDNRYKEKK